MQLRTKARKDLIAAQREEEENRIASQEVQIQNQNNVSQPGTYDTNDRVELWRAGYRDAGGPPQYEEHFIQRVIVCEYGGGNFEHAWRPYVRENLYVSRVQFHTDTWERAGGGDWNDEYIVGRNTANWVNRISEPGGMGGWPVCWWR